MLDAFVVRVGPGGSRALAELTARLAASPVVVEYAPGAGTPPELRRFVVCSTPDQRRRVAARLAAGGALEDFYGLIAGIGVTSDSVFVDQLATPVVIAHVRETLLPLLRAPDVRIFEGTTERTADFAAAPERLFE